MRTQHEYTTLATLTLNQPGGLTCLSIDSVRHQWSLPPRWRYLEKHEYRVPIECENASACHIVLKVTIIIGAGTHSGHG